VISVSHLGVCKGERNEASASGIPWRKGQSGGLRVRVQAVVDTGCTMRETRRDMGCDQSGKKSSRTSFGVDCLSCRVGMAQREGLNLCADCLP
jgi:hypothetical protein